MDHEARDDPVEGAALVGQGLPILAHSMLARTQLPKVFSCRRHSILIQLKDYSAPLVLPKWSDVKIHSGSVGPGRFLQVLAAMSAVIRALEPGVVRFSSLDLNVMLMGGLKSAGI